MSQRRCLIGIGLMLLTALAGCADSTRVSEPPSGPHAASPSRIVTHSEEDQAESVTAQNNDTSDGESLALTDDEIAAQNRTAEDLLHEKALEPEVLPVGTKRFTLTASVFPWHLYVGQTVRAWGFNGQVPGPLHVRSDDRAA